jgi:hypothetical protein
MTSYAFVLSINSINQIDLYWMRDDRASKVSGKEIRVDLPWQIYSDLPPPNKNKVSFRIPINRDEESPAVIWKKGFTQKYNVDKLVFLEQFDLIDLAISREKQIKGYSWTKKKLPGYFQAAFRSN